MKFEIEKNVALPIGHSDFPLEDMEVGDSFLLPKSEIIRLRSFLNHTFTRHFPERKFKTKSVDSKNYRCWRKV